MTKKFWKTVHKILYAWGAGTILLILSAVWIFIRKGLEEWNSLWYGKMISMVSGIWIALLVIFLFCIIGIRAHRGEF